MGFHGSFVDGDWETTFVVVVATAVGKLLQQLSHEEAVVVGGKIAAVDIHTIAVVAFGMDNSSDVGLAYH